MTKTTTVPVLAAAGLLLAGAFGPSPAAAQSSQQVEPTARAHMTDAAGDTVGLVSLTRTPDNGVLMFIDFHSAAPGIHAFHIHETGSCSPDFTAAGGHYNPLDDAHGALHDDGMHVGDLLNIHVPESGRLVTERHAHRATLDSPAPTTLFDEDGSAIVVHQGYDDYVSQPSGDGGARLYCGVIER